MDCDSVNIQKDFVCDGTVAAGLDIRIPAFGAERTDAFYKTAANRLRDFFEHEICPASEAEYQASDDPRKKWRFPATVLSVTAREERRKEPGRSVVLSVLISRGGKTVAKRLRRTVWSDDGKKIVFSGYVKPSKKRSGR